jgi:D-alanyl-D-alanine carboxypeptidase (penicillin-binding protein 5/6)
MRTRFKVESLELKANKRYFLFFFFFALFTLHFSLSTSFAKNIYSRAAVVMDSSTGKLLYAKNPDLRCAPASTTKLMTAIVVMENADLDDVVTISRNASRVSPHKAGLKEGDKVAVEKLLYAALVGSANDAAVALSEAVAGSEYRFVELMNKKAAAIRANSTHFINASGLPGTGQYTTASDLSKIMSYALKYPKLKEIIKTRVAEISTHNGNSIFLKNTNRLLWADDDLLGGKTGYTRKARHCFVCAAERDNDTVIVALLGSPSRDGLWRESEALINKGFDVMGNKAAPVIYLAKVNDNVFDGKKKSYKKKIKKRVRSAKSQPNKKLIAGKAGKQKKTGISAKKKGRAKVYAKYKGKKGCRVVKKGAVEKNKG